MLALFTIWYFLLITYFLLLDDPSKNENKDFLGFYFSCEFSTQFSNTISKASSLCSTKLFSQEDSKFADHVLQGEKKIKNSSLQIL
jgi:hypothetical protein